MKRTHILALVALLGGVLLLLYVNDWLQNANAQDAPPERPAVGGVELSTVPHTGKPLEEHMNPAGNKPLEKHMNPAGVKNLEEVTKPAVVKSPDEHDNPKAVKSLEEVTKPDGTVDVNELTVPSDEPAPAEDTETEE